MLCTFIRHIGAIYARELTQKFYHRLVFVHATYKEGLLDEIFDKNAQFLEKSTACSAYTF